VQKDSTVEAQKKFLRLDLQAAFDAQDLEQLERAIALAVFGGVPMIALFALISENFAFNKTNQDWFKTKVISGVNWSERCVFDSQLKDFCQRCCIKYGVFNPFKSIEWKLPK
jgi:hypothetical protein